MEALVISPDFIIEDIHKIREYHYELTKDMTTQEKINFYNKGGRFTPCPGFGTKSPSGEAGMRLSAWGQAGPMIVINGKLLFL